MTSAPTRTVGRCGDRFTSTITTVQQPPIFCSLPHGHPGWHLSDNGTEWNESTDTDLPLLLAAVDNALRNGSYMTGANVAFNRLYDHLGVDRDRLVFQSDWLTGIVERSAPKAS